LLKFPEQLSVHLPRPNTPGLFELLDSFPIGSFSEFRWEGVLKPIVRERSLSYFLAILEFLTA
jgi:hypothetical protein